MTETQQGVAQRVIADLSDNQAPLNANFIAGMQHGTYVMHRELSREARAILGQYKELEANAKATHDYHSASIYETTIEGMETLADNLGLDLEGDE